MLRKGNLDSLRQKSTREVSEVSSRASSFFGGDFMEIEVEDVVYQGG